jgi:hypothetical protein
VRVPDEQVSAAEKVAAQILKQAGVELQWTGCIVAPETSGTIALPCDASARSSDVVVYLVGPLEDHLEWIDRNALGYSIIPHADKTPTMAYVSYPRVQELSALTSADAAKLLGLAVAHEICHLLFRSRDHAMRGIMRGTWGLRDLRNKAWEEFQLTREQARRLRSAVQERLQADNLGINRPQATDYSPTVRIVQMVTESKIAPGYCERYRNDVLQQLQSFADLPPWRLAVTCDEVMWKYLRQSNHAERTETAFTNPKAADGRALTVLHGGAWSTIAELRQTLLHELKHIRCNCSLGE